MEIFQKGKYHCTVKKKKENLYKYIIIRTIWRKILNIFESSKKKKETSKDAALQRPQGFAFSEEAI